MIGVRQGKVTVTAHAIKAYRGSKGIAGGQ